jgi:hypothetical protein
MMAQIGEHEVLFVFHLTTARSAASVYLASNSRVTTVWLEKIQQEGHGIYNLA